MFKYVKRGNILAIQLTTGKFVDVVYVYGKVKFGEIDNNGGDIPLNFDYQVIDNPNDEDTTSKEFETILGDIIIKILEDEIANNAKIEFDTSEGLLNND